MPQHVAKPPKPAKNPPDMAQILKRIEAALRRMTWKINPDSPPGVIETYVGTMPGPGPSPAVSDADPWFCTALSYRQPWGDIQFAGACTSLKDMLLVNLTPELAELAVGLGYRSTRT